MSIPSSVTCPTRGRVGPDSLTISSRTSIIRSTEVSGWLIYSTPIIIRELTTSFARSGAISLEASGLWKTRISWISAINVAWWMSIDEISRRERPFRSIWKARAASIED